MQCDVWSSKSTAAQSFRILVCRRNHDQAPCRPHVYPREVPGQHQQYIQYTIVCYVDNCTNARLSRGRHPAGNDISKVLEDTWPGAVKAKRSKETLQLRTSHTRLSTRCHEVVSPPLLQIACNFATWCPHRHIPSYVVLLENLLFFGKLRHAHNLTVMLVAMQLRFSSSLSQSLFLAFPPSFPSYLSG